MLHPAVVVTRERRGRDHDRVPTDTGPRARLDPVLGEILGIVHRAVDQQRRVVDASRDLAVDALLEVLGERIDRLTGKTHHELDHQRELRAPHLVGEPVVALGLNVRTTDDIEGVLVHRLQRENALRHDPGRGQGTDDLLQVLHGVLRVAHAERAREAVRQLQVGDALRDLDVAFVHSEVGVGDGYRRRGRRRAPAQLRVYPLDVEQAHAAVRRRAPVAERTAVGAAPVRLDGHEQLGDLGEHVEQTGQERRRQRVHVADPVAVGVAHDAVAVAIRDAGHTGQHRQIRFRVADDRGECGEGLRRADFAFATDRDVDVRMTGEVVAGVALVLRRVWTAVDHDARGTELLHPPRDRDATLVRPQVVREEIDRGLRRELLEPLVAPDPVGAEVVDLVEAAIVECLRVRDHHAEPRGRAHVERHRNDLRPV